jgi:Lrp/AsnC family leucine-responsive transcriptional regulator
MAPSAILERIRKLERRGAIRGYEAHLDPTTIGLGLTAFAFVTALEPVSEMESGAALAEIPEVQEVHYIAGEDCYLVKIRVADSEALGRLIREKIGRIPGMHRTRTTIVLTSLKETSRLPLADLPARSR